MSCPTDSITSFPLSLGATQTFNDIRNNLTVEGINLIFKWGTSFSYPNIEVLNASSTEIRHNSFNLTSLVYNFLSYKLINVQITTANFPSWLSTSNSYDVVLTFVREPIYSSDNNKSPQIVLLVNPIIVSTTANNDFLQSLAGLQPTGAISQKNISAEKLFENNSENNYAYYTTCLETTGTFGNFQNMLVVINTGGTLTTTSTTIETIKSIITAKISSGITTYTPIYSNLVISPYSITNPETFKQKVKLSKGYIIREDIYQDKTDAYKCVPLNPENDVDGTEIKSNQNAESLKSVLDKREIEKNQYNDAFIKRMGLLSQVVTGILAVALGIVIIFIIIYCIRLFIFRKEPLIFADHWKFFSIIFVGIISTVIGIVIGYLIGFGVWKP